MSASRDTPFLAHLLGVLVENGHSPAPAQRSALIATPGRWWRALQEMTAGYKVNVVELLAVQFDDVPADEMVVLRNIEFVSLCEHHLMPFHGVAAVGYVPSGNRVVGLSKLARLVDAHARRLQVQERMTNDIAADLEKHVHALGAACVVRATHDCVACRGVRKQSAEMVTSALRGSMREEAARSEFLRLAGI